MKTIILNTSLFLCAVIGTFAQQPIEINGFRIIEINGEYYDISSADTLRIIPDVITLKYQRNSLDLDILALEQNFELEKKFISRYGWINYSINNQFNIVNLVQVLISDSIVENVLFNRYIPVFNTPNESAWETEFTDLDQFCNIYHGSFPIGPSSHLNYTPQSISHALMQIDQAWDITTGQPEIVIGFIDTGINPFHEDLEGACWQHPHNGNIGWNFVNGNNNLYGISSHGTKMTSIACARTNNDIGTWGVAGGWGSSQQVGSKAMILKVDNSLGEIQENYIIEALSFARIHGARIVNMSWGMNFNAAIAQEIDSSYLKDNIVFIAAVGNQNSNTISFPANHNYVNAVGATKIDCGEDNENNWIIVENRGIWQSNGNNMGSNKGVELDFVATPYSFVCDHNSPFTYTYDYSMTSGATAYASGVAALILSTNPCLTNIEVAEILKSTADKIDADNTNPEAQYDPITGHSLWYGYGRINAYKAVLEALDKKGIEGYAVTVNETWDTPRRYSGDFTVENGAILTLTSSLYMDAYTKITIKPGGKLVVDGGTITTACLDPWLGIEVLGNPNLDQTPPSQQGWVVVQNGGTIANAITGIKAGINYDPPESGTGNPISHTGGIIQVTNGFFRNNRTAIEFLPYAHASISFVKHSTFENDYLMLQTVEPDYFIKIYDINIIEVSGCSFNNLRATISDDSPLRGSGIWIVNGNLKNTCSSIITPCPPTEYHPNIFTNLYRGIYATSVVPNRYISIINCRFENNYRGLYLGGISNARVTSNLFKVGAPFTENGGYGMYLDACTGYWIEDNDFTHDFVGRKGVGIVVNNSGTAPNEIYRNRFVNLEMGVSAQGNNRNAVTGIGLQILCNDFIETDSDILVANPDRIRSFGIASWQGDSTFMAGNLFNRNSLLEFNDINNEGEHITYFAPLYPKPGDDERAIPQAFTESTVTVILVDLLDDWTYNIGCPCKLESGGGGHEEEMKLQIAESGQHANTLQEILNAQIDAGDTEGLHWDVYMSSSPEAMQVYLELMNTSPYLSDTVVSAAIFKEDVLIDAMLRDILVANPHTAKSGKLMDELEQRWTPLPEYMMAQVMQGKSMVSIRESMESTLARHQLDKTRAVNALARNWHNHTDSLVWLWSADNSPASKYKLAFLYLELNQVAQGTTVLNYIPTQFNISGSQQAEHQKIAAVYDLFASLAQEGKSILQADSLQIATLLEIEAGSNGFAGVYARNALLALQALAYDEPIILPDMMKSRAMAETFSRLLETRLPKHLGIFPIPARDYIVLEYVLDIESKGRIEFTDASGRLVHTLTVSGPINRKIIDTRHWIPGWYNATLKTHTKTLESVKFIISD